MTLPVCLYYFCFTRKISIPSSSMISQHRCHAGSGTKGNIPTCSVPTTASSTRIPMEHPSTVLHRWHNGKSSLLTSPFLLQTHQAGNYRFIATVWTLLILHQVKYKGTAAWARPAAGKGSSCCLQNQGKTKSKYSQANPALPHHSCCSF